jgi:hypothetical protein
MGCITWKSDAEGAFLLQGLLHNTEYFYMPVNIYSTGVRARLAVGACPAIELQFGPVCASILIEAAPVEGIAGKAGAMRSQLMAVALVALITPEAAPLDCRSAAAGYSAALASVTEALRTYEACIGASRGRNQCSAEFDELDGAHHDFEDAVAEYQRACPLAPREPR